MAMIRKDLGLIQMRADQARLHKVVWNLMRQSVTRPEMEARMTVQSVVR